MILVDFSSIIHRMVFTASKQANPTEIDGKYVTSEYANLLLLYIIRELISVQTQYNATYGEMVILFDDWTKAYWRKDFYSPYKAKRAGLKDKTKINYKEVYEYINGLVTQLEDNLSWRCIMVDKAEADDTIIVLSREFSPREKILIYSPDKDFIQCQNGSTNVDQYSPLTNKWLKATDKYDSMEHWELEHVIFGDESDGVPKIIAHTEFSDNFKQHLETFDFVEECHKGVHDFKYGSLTFDQKQVVLGTFTVQKKNRAGEDIGPDIYKDMRFGASGLKKALSIHGTLDKYLDSNPLYREHYNRNRTLVLEEGIPSYIRDETLLKYTKAKMEYNYEEFEKYLDKHLLFDIKAQLPKVFSHDEITVDNCGW